MAELQEDFLKQIVSIIEKPRMPQWWLDYAAQIAYNLQVHTKGLLFDKITGLYPHEHPDSNKFVVQSFEPITKGSIWKAINNIIRVFNNSSHNVDISDTLKTFLEDYDKNEGSFFSQFLDSWIKYAVAEDPNGICVVYPQEYAPDDFYRYVCYSDIIAITDDFLVFKSYSESEIKMEFTDLTYCNDFFMDFTDPLTGEATDTPQPNWKHNVVKSFNRRLKTTYLNPVYHVFTKEVFVRVFKPDPSDTEYSYEFETFKKPLDTLPYFQAGGVEIAKNVYESFVQPFVPFGNKALIADRNKRAVDLMFSYPRMSEVQQPCDDCKGSGWQDTIQSHGTCKTCRGAKFITPQSPFKVYRKVHDSFDADGKVFSTPAVDFHTPEVGILNYAAEQPDSYLEKAEEAVFVQQKVKTGNVEAAKSKQEDKEGMFAWLFNIAKVFYSNLELSLQYMENYLGTGYTAAVEKPYSFAILTESEAFEALTVLLTSPAPIFLKASQIDNFVSKFISESSPVKRAVEILRQFDPLLYYSDDAIAQYKGMGGVDQKILLKHIYAYPVLMKLYSEDPELFDKKDANIITMIQSEVDTYETTDLKTQIVKQLNQPKQLNGQGQTN
jgi:hypothetical protein